MLWEGASEDGSMADKEPDCGEGEMRQRLTR